VYLVLQEIGIQAKDALLVLNKIDRLPGPSSWNAIVSRYPNAIPISAKKRLGFEPFSYRVSDALSRTFRNVDVETGLDNGRLMAYLAAHGEILSKRYGEERVTVHCRIPQKYLGRIQGDGTVVRVHGEGAGDLRSAVSAGSETRAERTDVEAQDAAVIEEVA
jgi:GTP-binding protein HflX